MRRKITGVFLILLLLITGLSGCSKGGGKETGQLNAPVKEGQTKNSNRDKEEPTMGRYMEQKIALPELTGSSDMIIKILENKEKQIELYVQARDKILCYRLQEDTSWKESVPGWLNNDTIQKNSRMIQDLCMGSDGNYYAVYIDYSDNTSKTSVVKSVDGGETLQPVKIPYLEQEISSNNNKHYPDIDKIQVLGDGSMVLHDMWNDDEVTVFSPEGKETDKLRVGAYQSYTTKSYITTDKYIIAVNENGTGVVFYDPAQKAAERTVDFNNNGSYIAFALKKDDTLLFGDSGGIHRLQKDGTLWETTVDGSLNSMSMPTLDFNALYVAEGEQEEYYGVYGVRDGGYQLMHYVFDKNVASVPSKEITVYSLKENSTVRQAISLFQAENTDVKVNYVVAMGEEEGNVTDYIRALNTELLAGNGADVLVLDGLPVDSYIEKGILVDINDLISPMEEAGDLLMNISGCYKDGGKIYEMPVRFSIPVIAGSKGAIRAVDNLASIVSYINSNGTKPYFGSTTYRQLLEDFLALYSKDLISDNELNEENFTAFLKEIKSVAENIGAVETNENDPDRSNVSGMLPDNSSLFQGNILSIPKDAQASMLQVKNVFDSMLLFAVIKNNELGFESVDQRFLPGGMVGLNSKAKEGEIAKQFIRFLFGKEVQDANVYDGFPVNKKSMEGWLSKEDPGISIAVGDHEGNMLSAEWPDKEQRDSLLKMALDLKLPIDTNHILNDLIIESAIPYLKGEADESQTAAAVKAKINTYLAE